MREGEREGREGREGGRDSTWREYMIVQVEVHDNVLSSIYYLKCSEQNGSWTGDDAFNACTHVVTSPGT